MCALLGCERFVALLNEFGKLGLESLSIVGRKQAVPQLGAQFLHSFDDYHGSQSLSSTARTDAREDQGQARSGYWQSRRATTEQNRRPRTRLPR